MNTESRVAVIAVALGGVISVAMSDPPATLWDTIVAAILLGLLVTFGRTSAADHMERVVFGGVFALAAVLGIGPFFNIEHEVFWRVPGYLVLWLILIPIGFAVSRTKSSKNSA